MANVSALVNLSRSFCPTSYCVAFTGIGFAMLTVSFLTGISYNVVIA